MKKIIVILLALIGTASAVAMALLPHTPEEQIWLVGALLGFIVTCFSGFWKTAEHVEPVIKIGTRSPIIMPLITYIGILSLASLAAMPRTMETMRFFGLYLAVVTVVYGTGIYAILHRPLGRYRRRLRDEKTRDWKPGKKRLLLINPVEPSRRGLTVNASSKFPPLGLGIIAALTPDAYDVILIDENMEPFAYRDADLVGLTAFTAAAPRAYAIAAEYRRRKIPVVMGGIHASMNTPEALEHVDAVVRGEAESNWPRLIDDYGHDRLQRLYESDFPSLEGVVRPRRDIFSCRYLFATVQTSRGCPMDCDFCSVTAFNGRRYRHRPVEDVLEELETVPEEYLFFVDDNITGHSAATMDRALALFKGMVERNIRKKWFCQASVNFGTNEEVLRWAARAGCQMVFLGIESADPEELKAMNKNFNVRMEYETVFRNIHRHGIAVLGAFIVGTDSETPESIERKTNYIISAGVDIMQTTRLTPLPGTRLFQDLQKRGRLLFTDFPDDWSRYDMTEMLFQPSRISLPEMNRLDVAMNNRLYGPLNLVKKFMKTMVATRSLETAFWSFMSNLNYRNVFTATKSLPGRVP